MGTSTNFVHDGASAVRESVILPATNRLTCCVDERLTHR
jgi:hypothetical protein